MNTVMTDGQPQDLRKVSIDPAMARAAAALCTLKVEIDRQARGLIGQPFLDDWMGGRNTCAYFGASFLRQLLPFIYWEKEPPSVSNYFRAFVSPLYVVGASIKGLPEHVPAAEVEERINRYATYFGSQDNTCYLWFRHLGLFCAHEGKHRVAFMRHHQQPAIAAWVREASYPAADRLCLIRPEEEGDAWLAVLDHRYLQVVTRPRVTGMLLGAYGVRTVRWQDLQLDMPESAARQAVQDLGLHREQSSTAEELRTLDLIDLRQVLDQDAQITSRTVFNLAPLRLDWRRYVVVTSTCLGLATLILVAGWRPLAPLGWGLLGVATGLLLALDVARLHGPRVWTQLRQWPRRRR